MNPRAYHSLVLRGIRGVVPSREIFYCHDWGWGYKWDVAKHPPVDKRAPNNKTKKPPEKIKKVNRAEVEKLL